VKLSVTSGLMMLAVVIKKFPIFFFMMLQYWNQLVRIETQ
jgi:hypothetical protein